MLVRRYPIAVEKGDDSTAFGVIFPDVPGCYSAGDTLDEALINAKEALQGFLQLAVEDDDDIPQPSKLDEHMGNDDFDGFIWSFVEIDITPFLGKSRKVNVTLPESLIKQIDEVAAVNPKYKNRSGFLAKAAMHELASN